MIVKAVLSITFVITCVAIAIIDIQKQKIYNETVAVLLVPAIVSFFAYPEIRPASWFLGALSVSGVMLFMCLMIPGAFGGGDIKLAGVLGLAAGFFEITAALILGLVAASIAALIQSYIYKTRHIYTPLAPFLSAGFAAAITVTHFLPQIESMLR